MTIYTISVITSTGYPYYNLKIKNLPKGIKLFLRFFDFTQATHRSLDGLDASSSFELNAGLVSALFEFARNLDKKIHTLEFKSRKEGDIKKSLLNGLKYEGDVLITSQTETYLLNKSIKQKIELIYDTILFTKIPLENAKNITGKEEQKMIDILTDATAREYVLKSQQEIRMLANNFLKAMGDYGLEGICITSFDLSPLMVLGTKYSFRDIEIILRNLGEIPVIQPLEWKFRQSFHKGRQVWVYLINSSIGVTVEGLFEPYFYLLFCDPQSYLGEFPGKLTTEFNMILG